MEPSNEFRVLTKSFQTNFLVTNKDSIKENEVNFDPDIEMATSSDRCWAVDNSEDAPSSPSLLETPAFKTKQTSFNPSSALPTLQGGKSKTTELPSGGEQMYTRTAAFSTPTTVTNVLDGHVWTSEPEEHSSKASDL